MGIGQIRRPQIPCRRTLEDGGEENGKAPANNKCFKNVDTNPKAFANAKEAKVEDKDCGFNSSEERTIEDFDTINELGKIRSHHVKK